MEFLVQIMIELITTEQVSPNCAKSTDHRDLLAGSQGRCHCEGYPFPSLRLALKLLLASFCQRIKLCTSIGLRFSPRGGQPAGILQTMESREQRTRLHLECSIRHLRDSAGDAHPVQLLKREGLQYQDIECALQQIELGRGHHFSYCLSIRRS